MTDEPWVRRATRADSAIVSRTLADAFDDDPVMTWLLPHGCRAHDQRFRAFFGCETRGFFRRDKHVYLGGDHQSAALWAPPGTWKLTRSESMREILPMIAIFGTSLARGSRLATELDELHPRESHWYLYLLGTRADSQGHGLGAAMLREGLGVVDAAHEPAYLESSSERNLSLYERHGFVVTKEVTISGGGPPMWLMWRDAVA
jgi:ribosomal protein S18 acetylase RimI-like enzyme